MTWPTIGCWLYFPRSFRGLVSVPGHTPCCPPETHVVCRARCEEAHLWVDEQFIYFTTWCQQLFPAREPRRHDAWFIPICVYLDMPAKSTIQQWYLQQVPDAAPDWHSCLSSRELLNAGMACHVTRPAPVDDSLCCLQIRVADGSGCTKCCRWLGLKWQYSRQEGTHHTHWAQSVPTSLLGHSIDTLLCRDRKTHLKPRIEHGSSH